MVYSLFLLAVLVVLMAGLPLALKWIKQRYGHLPQGPVGTSTIVSAVAVGPAQKVVTVEVGPSHAKVWLVLGVTAQSIQCLHTLPLTDDAAPQPPEAPRWTHA